MIAREAIVSGSSRSPATATAQKASSAATSNLGVAGSSPAGRASPRRFQRGRQVDSAGGPFFFGDQITFQLSSKNTGAPRPDTIASPRDRAPARLPPSRLRKITNGHALRARPSLNVESLKKEGPEGELRPKL